MKTLVAMLAGCLAGISATFAFNHFHAPGSHSYQHQQATRSITSLSAGDISALEAGKGWGLAKPAEFNGYPGPLHVLDAAKDIALDDAQHTAIKGIYDNMSQQAKQLGKQYIAAESAIDQAFRQQNIDSQKLGRLIANAQDLRGRLRVVHLQAHLQTASLLNSSQIKKYVQIRGYANHGSHVH